MERKEKEKRKWEVIEDVVKKCGLKLEEGKRIISVWELAGELNNNWHTPLFCKKRKGVGMYESLHGDWALKEYELWRLVNALKRYLKKQSRARVIYKTVYNVWYEIDVREGGR